MKLSCLSLLIAVGFLLASSPLNGAEPLKPCAPEPGNTSIAYGDILGGANCEINPPTDVDLFSFTGSNGEIVRVAALRSGGNGFCVELRDPDGVVVPGPGPCTGSANFQADFTLTKTGVHTVLVQELSNDQTMTYGLLLNRLFPSTGSPTIDYGHIVMDDLDPAPDQDSYRLSGTTGDMIRLIALRTGGNGICVELRDPDGMVVPGPGPCTGSANFQADFTLTKTGVHTAIISELSNDQTASYTLSLTCLSGTCAPKLPVCDVSATFSTGTLNLDFTLRSTEGVLWGVWASVFGNTIPLWSVPFQQDSPMTIPLSVPGFPSFGTIGFLTTFAHPTKGIICADYATVDTGTPAAGSSTITPDQLRKLIQPRR